MGVNIQLSLFDSDMPIEQSSRIVNVSSVSTTSFVNLNVILLPDKE